MHFLFSGSLKDFFMWKNIVLPAFCVGAIAAFFVPAQGVDWLVWLGVLLLVLGFIFYKINQLSWFVLALVAVLLGASYSAIRTQSALSRQWQAAAESTEFHIKITGLPEQNGQGRTRFIAQATAADGRRYRLLFQDYQPREWRVGEHWRVKARVRAPIDMRNAVGFDRQAWALANGVDGMATVGKTRFRLPEHSWAGINGIRAQMVQNWQNVSIVYPQGAALMKALSVGDDSALSAAVWAALRPLGLNHLISISGLHITLIALLAAWISKKIMRLGKMPRRPRVYALAVAWLAAVVYTGLAGFEVPALRSLLMLSVFSWAWWRRGQLSNWQIWWAALAVVLLYQPMAVLAVGFWLSFGLVGGLLWVFAFRLPENHFEQPWQYRYHILKQAIKGQWAATLLGGVATLYVFGLLPIFSPLVNAVAIPVFSWLLTPAALLASALPFETPKQMAACLGEYTMQILLFLGNRLPEMALPHMPLPLFILAILAILLLLLPRGGRMKPLAMVILLAFLGYRPAVSGSLKATVYDVGQGLAILIQTPTQNILFDTGTSAAAEMALLPNLRAAHVRHLDALILSHHDDDHDGGLATLQKNLSIQTLWAGQAEFYPQAQHCTAGHNWQADGVDFTFLTMPNQQSDNDQSCVLQVRQGEHALLITGDISQKTEAQLIEKYGKNLKSNVLILAHHGSKSSSSAAFLRTVAPQAAVASSGFANAFRHPHPDIQRRLVALQIQLLRTDMQGGLVFDFTEKGVFYRLTASSYWWHRKPF